jgi:amidase
MSGKSWQDIAKIAQDLRDDSIAKVKPTVPDVPLELPLNVSKLPGELLSEPEISITETTPEKLLDALAAGKLTSTEVTNAFLRRAGLAQKLVWRPPVYPSSCSDYGVVGQLHHRASPVCCFEACQVSR